MTQYKLTWVEKTQTETRKDGSIFCVIRQKVYRTKTGLTRKALQLIEDGHRVDVARLMTLGGAAMFWEVLSGKWAVPVIGVEPGPGTVPEGVYMGGMANPGEKISPEYEASQERNRKKREERLRKWGPERPVSIHWRYYQSGDGWRSCWSTKKDSDGWFWSWQERPIGKGARRRFKRMRLVKNRKRKDARARAEKIYQKRQSL